MFTLKGKNLSKIRVSYSQFVGFLTTITNPSSSSYLGNNGSSATIWLPSRTTSSVSPMDKNGGFNCLTRSEREAIAMTFKDWFGSRNNALFDQIFKILAESLLDDDMSSGGYTDLALSDLGLRLNEEFVLGVLKYGYNKDVLSCLKFFDWAGRQHGFFHTRATCIAIFKILKRAKLMSLMEEFLAEYVKQCFVYKVSFNHTLVVGYSIAGKPEVALKVFGEMRFKGVDLDNVSYHVLLNGLVEGSCFDAVRVIANEIRMRGFENEITHSVMVKYFCKQKQLDEAEAYIRGLVAEGRLLDGTPLSQLVDVLCRSKKFEHAGKLIEEFQKMGMFSMEEAYNVWIHDLIMVGRLDGALEFLKSKKSLEGYVPDVFRYNTLIFRLLRENRLEEVCDLLMEMQENQIVPDNFTMNAVLCYFCKAGMIDIACNLYNSRSEFELSPFSLAYNFLINTLCGDGSIEEAYGILQNAIGQGYFPGKTAFNSLADALCREGKLDKMKELVVFALERNVMPSSAVYDKFISALCWASRVEDGYLIYGELNRINRATRKSTYCNLISGFNRLNRGDISARLLIEMQEKGCKVSRKLFRPVLLCLCEMENPEKQFFQLLDMQLNRYGSSSETYNFFIDGAGHAKKPDLARQVYEMMQMGGIKPSLSSDILMLQSYLKSERISDALNFFRSVRKRRVLGRKLYSNMVSGLCKAKRDDLALEFFREMKENQVVPSLECYELLIQLLCSNEKYGVAVNLLIELERTGRPVSSFIGNTLLLHSFRSQELYEAWSLVRDFHNEKSEWWMLRMLIGAFCGRIRVTGHTENVEEEIEKCFRADRFTFNMFLRRLCWKDIDGATKFFHRMVQKGYEPNEWTYDILVHGFFKHGKTSEANKYLEHMLNKGFQPTERTLQLIS
ncbi:hypothetical protein UlMin_030023 [Ulmus minor]